MNEILLSNLSIEQLSQRLEQSLDKRINQHTNQQTNENNIELLSREEAAEFLKVDLSTLWRWTKNGYLNQYAIGRKIFYKKSEVIDSLIQIQSHE